MKKTSIFTRENDIVWFLIWFFVLALLFIWDSIFLDTQNNPAFRRVLIGTLNTGFVGLLSVVITVALAIYVVLVIQIFKKGIFKPFYIVIQFILNFIRSIPQVVGVLLGYLGLSLLVEYNLIHNRWSILALTSCCISLFMVNEVIDLLVDRIKYFKKNDFYNAMR